MNSIWTRFRWHKRLSPSWTRIKSNPKAQFFGMFNYYLFLIATWSPLPIIFTNYVADLTFVNGPSMYPYFNAEKDQTLRNDLALNWKFNAQYGLSRGMIVTLWSPNNPEIQSVKRIVGLEGDIVRTRTPYPYPTIQVPAGHIWIEGDGDPKDSSDSNMYGPVATGLVTGKVVFILRPLHRAGWVKWWECAEHIRKHS